MLSFNNFPAPGASWRHVWSPAAVLRVRGEDALSFLQGQFSQDLLPPGVRSAAVYGLWLNHKGRVLGDSFALVAGPQEVWLISYYSTANVIRSHLENHILADDVTVEVSTAGWQGVSLGAVAAQAQWGDRLPPPTTFACHENGFLFCGRRGGQANWEWLTSGPPPPVPAEASAVPDISAARMEQMRIAAGVPAIPTDLGPGDLPFEGGLDTVAVSSTKGCYLGQEVMARLRTGTIRRRLMRVVGKGPPPAGLPGPLYQGDKKIGELRSRVADDAGGFIGLGTSPVATAWTWVRCGSGRGIAASNVRV